MLDGMFQIWTVYCLFWIVTRLLPSRAVQRSVCGPLAARNMASRKSLSITYSMLHPTSRQKLHFPGIVVQTIPELFLPQVPTLYFMATPLVLPWTVKLLPVLW